VNFTRPVYLADNSNSSGSIWLGDTKEADFFVIGGALRDEKTGNLILNVRSEFVCGTEFDESELNGSCEVQLTKTDKWSVTNIANCTCGF
jgi:hypothetical protein